MLLFVSLAGQSEPVTAIWCDVVCENCSEMCLNQTCLCLVCGSGVGLFPVST